MGPRRRRTTGRPPARRRRLLPAALFMTGLALVLLAFSLQGCATAGIRPSRSRFQAPRAVRMSVTGYCNCGRCCGWRYTWYGRRVFTSGSNKGRPKKLGVTASGTRARPGTVAADTALYPMGTIVHVPGYGYGRVEDTGGAIKGDKLDLWFRSHQRAKEWGRKDIDVRVWLPK